MLETEDVRRRLHYGVCFAAGVEQLIHYMDNKKSHIGHLVIFDAEAARVRNGP